MSEGSIGTDSSPNLTDDDGQRQPSAFNLAAAYTDGSVAPLRDGLDPSDVDGAYRGRGLSCIRPHPRSPRGRSDTGNRRRLPAQPDAPPAAGRCQRPDRSGRPARGRRGRQRIERGRDWSGAIGLLVEVARVNAQMRASRRTGRQQPQLSTNQRSGPLSVPSAAIAVDAISSRRCRVGRSWKI